MEFKTTSTKNRCWNRASGATLVEYVVATAITLTVTIAIMSFSIYTSRSLAGMMNYVELENQSRLALDTMTKEIRQTTALTAFTTNSISFQDYDTNTLTYAYSPSDGTLTRTKSGTSKVLLSGCDLLNFSIYQRNTTNGTYDQYPTSLQASNAKVIQMNWVCTRTVTGYKLNSDTVQTAKIVIRNQQQP